MILKQPQERDSGNEVHLYNHAVTTGNTKVSENKSWGTLTSTGIHFINIIFYNYIIACNLHFLFGILYVKINKKVYFNEFNGNYLHLTQNKKSKNQSFLCCYCFQ